MGFERKIETAGLKLEDSLVCGVNSINISARTYVNTLQLNTRVQVITNKVSAVIELLDASRVGHAVHLVIHHVNIPKGIGAHVGDPDKLPLAGAETSPLGNPLPS